MKPDELENPRAIAMKIIAECGTDYTKLKNAITTALKTLRSKTRKEDAEIAASMPDGCCGEYSDCSIAIEKAILKKDEEERK